MRGPGSANITGLMLLGAADDLAPPALCDSVAKGMPQEKLRVITYPDARHGCDQQGLPRHGHLANLHTKRGGR